MGRAAANPRSGATMSQLGEAGQGILSALAALALACLALAVYAFSQPLERTVADDMAYQQNGEFSYSAVAPVGSVYDAGQVETGEPVFRRLVSAVVVGFDYSLTTERPLNVAGSYRLSAVLSDPNG